MELELEKKDDGEELGCLKELNQNVMTGTSEDQLTMRNKIAGKWKRISRSFQKGNGLNNEENKENELVENKRGMMDEGEVERGCDTKAKRVETEKNKQFMNAE